MNEFFQEEVAVYCPYCGEAISPLVDFSGGVQEFYEDCSVCCAPIVFSLTESDEGGELQVQVRRDDDC